MSNTPFLDECHANYVARTAREEAEEIRVRGLEDRIKELDAKVAWLEGKGPPAMCGYPWEQPYQDGYSTSEGKP